MSTTAAARTTGDSPAVVAGQTVPKRIVTVTKAQIAAARAQVHISEQLGVQVPKVIRKIAQAS